MGSLELPRAKRRGEAKVRGSRGGFGGAENLEAQVVVVVVVGGGGGGGMISS